MPGSDAFRVGNIFPNPVQDIARVEITSTKSVQLKIALYSNAGMLVKTYPDKAIYGGNQLLSLPLGELPAGVYYLKLNDGKSVVVKKIIKS